MKPLDLFHLMSKIRVINDDSGCWYNTEDVVRVLGLKGGGYQLVKYLQHRVNAHLYTKKVYTKDTSGRTRELHVLSEMGLYYVIIRGRTKEAERLQDVVLHIIARQGSLKLRKTKELTIGDCVKDIGDEFTKGENLGLEPWFLES